MKLLAVNRLPGTDIDELPKVDLLADSSIVTPGKPLFLPEIAENYHLVAAPAFRICRLGKNIAERFAYRYFDAMTIVLRVIPELPPDIPASALTTAFDSASVEGKWLNLPEFDTPLNIEIQHSDKISISINETGIGKAISVLSRHFTMKNGDIILPCMFPTEYTAVIDTRFNVSINGNNAIDLKIK